MAREGTGTGGRRSTSGDFSGADLAGQDFSGANLAGRDFSDAHLASANLSGANLRGADFSGADLTDADLHGANLAAADLSGSDLTDVNVSGANLANADLADAALSGADLSGANLGTRSGSIPGSDGSLASTVRSIVTAATLTLGFVLLAAGWSWWWVVFVIGFAAVSPVASTLAERYEARSTESGSESAGDGQRADALEALRGRYAAGEIDEAEFERRVERLLETESVSDAETFYPTGDDPEEVSDRAEDPVAASDRADDDDHERAREHESSWS